jgi:hypothetical protein
LANRKRLTALRNAPIRMETSVGSIAGNGGGGRPIEIPIHEGYVRTMSTITFDTLKFVERLEAGGFTHEQAKAAAEAFAEATSQEMATKADIASLRSEIREMELRLTNRLGGMMVVAVGVLLAAIRYLPPPGH